MNFVSFNLIILHSSILLFLILSNVSISYAQASSDLNYDENLNIYRVVALRNQNNPIESVSNAVVVEKPYALYSPNAFSPDGDGINDFFKISGQGMIDYRIEIFNRWGQMVYKSIDLSNGWDGTFKGKNLPTGTYVYKIKTSKYGVEQELVKSGSVALVR
jgi:gliding motility-associated-like protein